MFRTLVKRLIQGMKRGNPSRYLFGHTLDSSCLECWH